ncbi:MAG: hypothetical protein AB7P76_03525 [Candidatus Melainabacteria bacterium]
MHRASLFGFYYSSIPLLSKKASSMTLSIQHPTFGREAYLAARSSFSTVCGDAAAQSADPNAPSLSERYFVNKRNDRAAKRIYKTVEGVMTPEARLARDRGEKIGKVAFDVTAGGTGLAGITLLLRSIFGKKRRAAKQLKQLEIQLKEDELRLQKAAELRAEQTPAK